MKTYYGRRNIIKGCEVYVTYEGKLHRLNPRLDIWNKSPTGFEWGYGGSGPAQLAIALLADAYDDKIATQYFQNFKRDVVSTFSKDRWELTEDEIKETVEGYLSADL